MATTQQGCRYEELAHTAEVGVRVETATVDALYACAALAMFALLHMRPEQDAENVVEPVSVESGDAESLMVDWLGELLYLYETTGRTVVACAIVAWSPTHLDAEVTLRAPAEAPTMQIKAVTYHQLSVRQTDAGWVAEVYFDI